MPSVRDATMLNLSSIIAVYICTHTRAVVDVIKIYTRSKSERALLSGMVCGMDGYQSEGKGRLDAIINWEYVTECTATGME